MKLQLLEMSCEQTPCSVGLHLRETCHKLSYKQIGQRVSSELSDVEKDLIMWRTGLPAPGPEGFTILYVITMKKLFL